MTVNPTIQHIHQQFVEQLCANQTPREAQSIARIVFEDVFGIHNFSRKDELSTAQLTQLDAIGQRLLNNEPLQYILGQADFYGMSLKVSPAVLIPRPETEELVYWMSDCITKEFSNTSLAVLDIGTGSGCIPIALKARHQALNIQAVDVSMDALAVAHENALAQQSWINFRQLDILDETQWSTLPSFDIIVSNPPYIPMSEQVKMPPQVLAYEPELALFVEESDPLVFYRKIGEFAKLKLNTGGQLFFETNEFNAKQVEKMLYAIGFETVVITQDMSGKDRMIKAML
ncbi:MAG: peptide chain release factor N(5)-glutamine methyltransferase [Saprospiraceae bacterium]